MATRSPEMQAEHDKQMAEESAKLAAQTATLTRANATVIFCAIVTVVFAVWLYKRVMK